MNRMSCGLRSISRARRLLDSLRSHRDAVLAVRMFGWALVLPFLKHVVSIDRLAVIAWKAPKVARRRLERERRIADISHLMHRSRRPSGRYNCLERSLITYRYLSELNADPQLVLGVRRANGSIEGHSWILVDGAPVRESTEMLADFEPLVAFGARGERQRTPRS
jgi:hypothetical protein